MQQVAIRLFGVLDDGIYRAHFVVDAGLEAEVLGIVGPARSLVDELRSGVVVVGESSHEFLLSVILEDLLLDVLDGSSG